MTEPLQKMLYTCLQWTSALALLGSAVAFCTLLVAPRLVEEQVRGAVTGLLTAELHARFGVPPERMDIVGMAKRTLQERLTHATQELDNPAHERFAAWLAQLCHYECGSQAAIAEQLRASVRSHVGFLAEKLVRVERWAASRYAGLVRELVAELRIFTGLNSALFLLAFLGMQIESHRSARAEGRATPRSRVYVVAGLLLFATALAAYLYIAQQNWLLTFVLSDYVGFGYLALVGVLFVLLIDVVFLEAQISRSILEGLASLGK